MDREFNTFDHLLLLSRKKDSSKVLSTIITTTTTTTTKIARGVITAIITTTSSAAQGAAATVNIAEVTLRCSHSPCIASTMGTCFGSLQTRSTPIAARLWREATDEQEAELMVADEEEEEAAAGRKEKLIFRIIKFKRKKHKQQNVEPTLRPHIAIFEESVSDIQLQNLDVSTLLHCSPSTRQSTLTGSTSAHVCSRTSSSLDLEWEHEYGPQVRSSEATTAVPSASSINSNHLFPLNNAWLTTLQDLASEMPSVNASTTLCPNSNTETSVLGQGQPMKRTNCRPSPRHNASSFTRTSSRTSCSHISTPESLEWDIDEEQQRQLYVEDDNLGLETLELLHQIEQLKNRVLNETGDGLHDLCGEMDAFSSGSVELLSGINIS